MKNTTFLTSAAAAGLLMLALAMNTGCNPNEAAANNSEIQETAKVQAVGLSQEEMVRRGAYLVTIMGCDDCHTPKKMTEHGPAPDMDRRLMGHPADQPLPKLSDPDMVAPGNWAAFNGDLTAAVGPWGVSFAGNLTPDPTGIGFWKEENFLKAIREGKLKGIDGSRPLLPPMPWPNYAQASDEDLKAIFAYLKSIKPIKNVVPAPIPPDQLSLLQ